MMLGDGKYRGIVCSTLPEIIGALPLVKEGVLDEVCPSSTRPGCTAFDTAEVRRACIADPSPVLQAIYGLPIAPSKLPRLAELRESIRIVLIVDHEQQIEALEDFATTAEQNPWPIFIKIDVGSKRAGIPPTSPRLAQLVRRATASPSVDVLGFYAHAGHSYGSRSVEAAEAFLADEADALVEAAHMLQKQPKVILSIGSTPTAHVVSALRAKAPANAVIELHAGNFPCNDLQQVATGVIEPCRQAVRVHAEVCSVYPERNEVLVNAGAIALSKETSEWKGFGHVVGMPGWHVARMSQEHGILAYDENEHAEPRDGDKDADTSAEASSVFQVGDTVQLHVNHTCITAAAFFAYFVVDENDVVVDVWVPWKGW